MGAGRDTPSAQTLSTYRSSSDAYFSPPSASTLSTMVATVQKPAPAFKSEAVVDGLFKELSLADYLGQWCVPYPIPQPYASGSYSAFFNMKGSSSSSTPSLVRVAASSEPRSSSSPGRNRCRFLRLYEGGVPVPRCARR